LNLQIADIVRDRDILAHARHFAIQLLKDDPGMAKPEHAAMRQAYLELTRKKSIWNYIS